MQRILTEYRRMNANYETTKTYYYISKKFTPYQIDYELSKGSKPVPQRTEWYSEKVNGKSRITKIVIKEFKHKDKVVEFITYEEEYTKD